MMIFVGVIDAKTLHANYEHFADEYADYDVKEADVHITTKN